MGVEVGGSGGWWEWRLVGVEVGGSGGWWEWRLVGVEVGGSGGWTGVKAPRVNLWHKNK